MFRKTWPRVAATLIVLVFLFAVLPTQSVSAAPLWQEEIRIAENHGDLWFALIAMGSLVLLGLVWVLWPERRSLEPSEQSN
ncbi:MAG: hypothetical protein KDE31_25760 [Caldilineaceae bacterium]|nr:hypothetical protein [Caldilineaceae bacterium]